MQLLMVQRLDGALTIGDTHEYDEPFAFDVTEEPYDHLADTAVNLLGRPLPKIRRRWAGVYAQALDPGSRPSALVSPPTPCWSPGRAGAA